MGVTRTNIVIDDELMTAAMTATGLTTKKRIYSHSFRGAYQRSPKLVTWAGNANHQSVAGGCPQWFAYPPDRKRSARA